MNESMSVLFFKWFETHYDPDTDLTRYNEMFEAFRAGVQCGLHTTAAITQREKALWDLLDDIDAAFGAFQPRIEDFEYFVQCKVNERHQYLAFDGHELHEATE